MFLGYLAEDRLDVLNHVILVMFWKFFSAALQEKDVQRTFVRSQQASSLPGHCKRQRLQNCAYSQSSILIHPVQDTRTRPRRGTQQDFMREAPPRGPTPYPFICHLYAIIIIMTVY